MSTPRSSPLWQLLHNLQQELPQDHFELCQVLQLQGLNLPGSHQQMHKMDHLLQIKEERGLLHLHCPATNTSLQVATSCIFVLIMYWTMSFWLSCTELCAFGDRLMKYVLLVNWDVVNWDAINWNAVKFQAMFALCALYLHFVSYKSITVILLCKFQQKCCQMKCNQISSNVCYIYAVYLHILSYISTTFILLCKCQQKCCQNASNIHSRVLIQSTCSFP